MYSLRFSRETYCVRGKVIMAQEEYPITWQDVSTNNNYETKRFYVPGGWIVAVRDTSGSDVDTNVVFVPDPSHFWNLET